ncbi:extracellular solute-binding protein [Streptomyces sp. NPDC057638]|uniref:extracellular solute-binding protein n=1 Tax=Streptomyces sp. NPDC057638 TaxID=3346190 RepID=UPI0036A74C9A
MKLSSRIATPMAALVLAGLTATACAPQTTNKGSDKDEKSGTLRVWLFQEVGNDPKKKVVDEAVAAFTKQHKDAKVEIEYIPIETRAQRIKAAFNDPKSAPDIVEFGNTDTAGYVKDGGLLDISKEFAAWDETKDADPTATQGSSVDGKVFGAPFFVGIRALYYRTDVFQQLKLPVPKTLDEVAATAKKIRKAKPELYGIAVGGAYTYGAMPFLWANGGDIAKKSGDTYKSAINSAETRKGIEAYTSLFKDDNCPAAKCASMGGNATVTAFASGKAAMAIGGNFSRGAVDAGAAKGKYAVVPLPGTAAGQIAPAFAGGGNIGVLKSTTKRTLAFDLVKHLTGKESQRKLFEAMGFLPTFKDVQAEVAKKDPFVVPFVNTLSAGTKFVPVSPAWGQIDASLVLPTMFQEIVSGKKDVAKASDEAAAKMDAAFSAAG